MTRRRRAILFGLAAILAAGLAAALADGYGARVARGYGELRPVVVAAVPLPVGQPIDPEAAAGLDVRRVPVRFVPPGALASPDDALGLAPEAAVPAGSYLLASQLQPPGAHGKPGRILGEGRRPVQLTVTGAGALLAAGTPTRGTKVDVVVTSETGSGAGRTRVAAPRVPLLALAPGTEAAAPGEALATLGLTRAQALRLIEAESFARQVTLLAGG